MEGAGTGFAQQRAVMPSLLRRLYRWLVRAPRAESKFDTIEFLLSPPTPMPVESGASDVPFDAPWENESDTQWSVSGEVRVIQRVISSSDCSIEVAWGSVELSWDPEDLIEDSSPRFVNGKTLIGLGFNE